MSDPAFSCKLSKEFKAGLEDGGTEVELQFCCLDTSTNEPAGDRLRLASAGDQSNTVETYGDVDILKNDTLKLCGSVNNVARKVTTYAACRKTTHQDGIHDVCALTLSKG
jgi:hypothetical protein